MKLRILSSFLATTLTLATGCAEGPIEPVEDGNSKADQISGRDDPSGLLGNAERRLAKLVTEAEVGESFGVPREETPYPDTYWPMVDDGIAVEWMEKDGTECFTANECADPELSPLEKLLSITNPSAIASAKAWEIKNHGSEVPNVASWFGHCPGWVANAILNGPVTAPVFVRGSALGLEKCPEGEPGCVRFEIGDVNALGAEIHEGAFSRFIGARCDTEPTEIKRDEFGRIVRDGRGCKGLNAGSMLILMGNRLKNDQTPFAIDAQEEFTTDQIWNQPAYKYTVNKFGALTESEAANLVASGGASKTGDQNRYLWNNLAAGFVFIDFTLHWVTETSGPNTTVVNGADSSNSTRMVAVIELDKDASNDDAKVIGGEYLDDESVGASRLSNHPFAWIPLDAGPEFRHNPFVKNAHVKQLLAIAKEARETN